MKQLLLFSCFLLFGFFANSQNLRVVKDNLNCTYGIKDNDGNWVVEANYILIEEYNSGYFRVRDVDGLGVFNTKGKEIIPCIHDRIDVSSYNWRIRTQYDALNGFYQNTDIVYLYGVHGEKQTVYNLKGFEIGTFGARAKFFIDSDQSIIAYDEQSMFSSYVDSSGVVIIDSIAGKLSLFNGKNYAFVANNISGNGRVNGNVRLIDRKGESIVDVEMDDALVDSRNRICYYKDKFYGVVSMSGETIIAPKYRRLDAVLNLEQKKSWVIYDSKDRAGIMKNDGSVLVEPVYDRIYSVNGNNRTAVAWMVEKDDIFGIINLEGKMIVPMHYDQLHPIHYDSKFQRKRITKYIGLAKGKHYYVNPVGADSVLRFYDSIYPISQYNYSYSLSITRGLITKRNGKYGVLHPNGSEITGHIYDAKFELYDTRYLMGQGKRLIEYNFSREAIDTIEWMPCASDGSLYIFKNRVNMNYIAVKQSAKGGKNISLDSRLQSFQEYGNLLTAMYSDTRKWILFNLNTKKKLPLKNITSFSSNRHDQFAISTSFGHSGILDSDGNLVVDTIYNSVILNRNSSKIWATKIVEDRYVTVLLDSIGRQVIPNQFDASFELKSGDQIVSQNQKKGLIDSKTLEWKIRPNHLCLIKLFDDYYYAGNESNKKGIIRPGDEVVIPIVYDSIILMSTNCQLNGRFIEGDTEVRWIVRKGSTEYLVDQNGKLINSKSAIMNLKAKLFFDDDSSLGSDTRYRRFPTLDYSQSLHFLRGLTLEEIRGKRKALWTNQLLRNKVLDTVNRIWLTQGVNCNQRYYWQVSTVGEQEKPSPVIEQARKSCDCFQSNRYNYGGNQLSYQLRSIGSKFVTLDISYQNLNNGWDEIRVQNPPLIASNQHVNIIERNGKARYLSLKEIFPDDEILMQEFIISLQKRDDLKLKCSSLENMLEMINGSFSLSDEGVILHLGQFSGYSNSPAELLIPIENLKKLPTSKWIVPILSE